jgi:hypothetical protein
MVEQHWILHRFEKEHAKTERRMVASWASPAFHLTVLGNGLVDLENWAAWGIVEEANNDGVTFCGAENWWLGNTASSYHHQISDVTIRDDDDNDHHRSPIPEYFSYSSPLYARSLPRSGTETNARIFPTSRFMIMITRRICFRALGHWFFRTAIARNV